MEYKEREKEGEKETETERQRVCFFVCARFGSNRVARTTANADCVTPPFVMRRLEVASPASAARPAH